MKRPISGSRGKGSSDFRFRLWSSVVPAKLAELDAALSEAGIPYFIKSLGRSDVVTGLIRTARFRLVVGVQDSEAAETVIRKLTTA